MLTLFAEANDFTPFMERALNVIYGLADIPDVSVMFLGRVM